MRYLTIAALLVSTAALTLPARADEMKMDPHPAMATMVCRPAAAGEKGNAMMNGPKDTALVCKALPDMHAGKMKMPAMKSKTDEDDTWKWLEQMLAVPTNA